jgi:hypothetical protein
MSYWPLTKWELKYRWTVQSAEIVHCVKQRGKEAAGRGRKQGSRKKRAPKPGLEGEGKVGAGTHETRKRRGGGGGRRTRKLGSKPKHYKSDINSPQPTR